MTKNTNFKKGGRVVGGKLILHDQGLRTGRNPDGVTFIQISLISPDQASPAGHQADIPYGIKAYLSPANDRGFTKERPGGLSVF